MVPKFQICTRLHSIVAAMNIIYESHDQLKPVGLAFLTRVAAHVHADTIPEAIRPGLKFESQPSNRSASNKELT